MSLSIGQPLRLGQVEQSGRRAREAVGVAELRDADEAVHLGRLRRQDLRSGPDLQLRLIGAVLVDDDLVVRRRWTALDEVEGRELIVGLPRESERGRALARVADGFAVRAHDLRVGDPDTTLGRLDARRLAYGGKQRDRDVGPVAGAEVAAEALRRAHDRIGVAVDVGEQVVEGLLDRRGQHESARYECHA